MSLIAHGTVRDGTIILEEPLALPDGAHVVVSVAPVASSAGEDFATLPSFGMWAERRDLHDSHSWLVSLWDNSTDEERGEREAND